jgi:hypothetical protein
MPLMNTNIDDLAEASLNEALNNLVLTAIGAPNRMICPQRSHTNENKSALAVPLLGNRL